MQHLQPLPEAAAPDISHIHQQTQPSAPPSQIVLDRLEAQKKHLKEVLRKKEEEIAQRQTQIAVKATKYSNAPMSEVNAAREMLTNERDSSNKTRELDQQKDQKESTKNREAATKKGREKMNRRKAKGRKKSDRETSSAGSKDISLEVVDEASAAVKASPGNAVPQVPKARVPRK